MCIGSDLLRFSCAIVHPSPEGTSPLSHGGEDMGKRSGKSERTACKKVLAFLRVPKRVPRHALTFSVAKPLSRPKSVVSS